MRGCAPTRAMQFMDSVSQPIIAATNQLVIYPPFLGGYLLSNFIQPVYRLSRTPVSDETPHHRLVSGDRQVQELEQAVSATRQAISALCDGGVPPPLPHRSWTLLHPSPGIWWMRSSRLQFYVGRFAPLLHSLGFRHLRSVSLLLRLSSQVLRIQKMTLHTLVHLGDGPTIPLRVRLGIFLARGVILLPARGVGSRTIRLLMRARRLQIADNGTISRMTRNIFVMLLWLFCWTTS